MTLLADNEGPDQTALLPFAVRICPKTCFLMTWPKHKTDMPVLCPGSGRNGNIVFILSIRTEIP